MHETLGSISSIKKQNRNIIKHLRIKAKAVIGVLLK
jgi:hypothetical protein